MILYNEYESYAAQWLRNLITMGHLPPGRVDDRDLRVLDPAEMPATFHAFAGIGGWPLALRMAGWPDDVPVWTGSCPCQPFSQAGKKKGFEDDRHVWPVWCEAIREQRPSIVFGEQVASPAGREWLSAVRAEMEALGYVVGGADLCAAGVGAPHIRQRLWFVAIADGERRKELCLQLRERGSLSPMSETIRGRTPGFMGDASGQGGWRDAGAVFGAQTKGAGERRATRDLFDQSFAAGAADVLADAHGAGRSQPWGTRAAPAQDTATERSRPASLLANSADPGRRRERGPSEEEFSTEIAGKFGRPGAADPWSNATWLPCTDGKARPIEPGTLPLAHGVPDRVGQLRGYGNAIVPQVAVVFIRAAMEALADTIFIQRCLT